ncbi:hypothetical protein N824_16020 [Pedobacter sp. V48]|nr:hypothetical protein N824_16020 [Pedobacter sp. V48]
MVFINVYLQFSTAANAAKSLFNALKGIIKASIIPAKLLIKKLWKNFLFIYVFLA